LFSFFIFIFYFWFFIFDFVSTLSRGGKYIVCLTDDGFLYSVSTQTAIIQNCIKVLFIFYHFFFIFV
jgi:hypothetical protein